MIGLHHRMVLNSDVVFRSGGTGAAITPGDLGDSAVILTRRASRFPSLAVNRETAEFLLAFTEPCALAIAVQLVAKRLGASSEEVLTEIYPNLHTFVERGILVRVGRTRRNLDVRRIGQWEIQRSVHDFDDSAVLLVRNDKGVFGALKLIRGARAAGVLARERQMLEVVGTELSPAILDSNFISSVPYLVTEWKPGLVAADAFRELRTTGSRPALLRLAVRMLNAFENLHELGVIHGDIQPKNVLFDFSERMWILDFTNASAPGSPCPWRSGVPFFFEPEYAKALLTTPPKSIPASLHGENYGIAALLFYLLSGVHTIEFSVERETMLKQIAERETRPLVDFRGVPWPAAAEALRPYLSKDPRYRPESLDPMRDALAAEADAAISSQPEAAPSPRLLNVRTSIAPERYIKDEFGLRSERLQKFDVLAPRCSLNFGAAGISYALLRAAELSNDAELLWAADAWIEQAEKHMKEPEAFTAARLELTRRRVGYASLACCEPGLFFVKSLVRASMDDPTGTRVAVEQFMSAANYRWSRLADLNLGGIGLALAADSLQRLALSDEQKRRLGRLRERLVDRAWQTVSPSFAPNSRLGFAHGIAGLVFGALTVGHSECVEKGVSELRRLAVMLRRGIRWPVRSRTQFFMPGWCNGVPGHLLMWARLWQQSGTDEDRDMAERCAWGVWESRTTMGNLCCGATGQAAALATFACVVDEPVWRGRACEMLDKLRPTWPKDDHPQSLFRGELGLQLMRLECESGATVRFPVWGDSLVSGIPVS
jgi:serine/threonine protein kinase